MTSWRNPITALYPLLSGAIFFGLGVLTLIRPEVLKYYSIGVDNSPARTAVRAMIGGGEVGIGVVLLAGAWLGLYVSQRCTLAAMIFVCVGLARLLSVGFEGDLVLASQPLREASLELTLGCLGVYAAIIARKAELDG